MNRTFVLGVDLVAILGGGDLGVWERRLHLLSVLRATVFMN